MLNRFLFFVLLILLVTVGCEYSYEPSEPTADRVEATEQILPSGTPIEGQYIIVMKKKDVALGKSTSEMTSLAKNLLTDNEISSDVTDRIYTHAISGFTATLSRNDAAKLRLDPRVAIVEQDRIISLAKPAWAGGGNDDPEPQLIPWGITRVGGAADGSGMTAWIIDTGIDLEHADLNVNVALSANFVPRGKKSPNDGNGHGTHVAGTIAAIDNDIDVVGVAAGASVVAVRVLDNSGSGAYSWVIAGVDYVAATAEAGDVANLSLGGPTSDALDLAVLNAAGLGIKFSLAAGNSGADANNYSPGRVNHANVYTISAIDDSDIFASFSNWGNPPVDYAAPGVGVLSLLKGGGTTTKSGTSMSAQYIKDVRLVKIGGI
ncbi:S8 family peptidase [Candidatus Marinimicrobia bacterium MT.SAG.4]|nr:S8 family peptidase [Candidatus Marinimicrobia bacterium MT.SAG.4]